MTVAVLDYSNGDVDIIEGIPEFKDGKKMSISEKVENYLVGQLQYNSDEISYMILKDGTHGHVNYLTPNDFGR